MFGLLNRLRGTKAYFAKIVGLVIGVIAYMTLGDIIVAVNMAIGYVIGESMGWGKWIGGIMSGNNLALPEQLADEEGRRNGIHWITSKLFNEVYEYQRFCNTALGIRGLYWAFLTLLPLFAFGYLGVIEFHALILFLAVMFPVSIHIGMWTSKKFSYANEWFGMNGAWEQAEVWYGLAMDAVLVYLIL